MRIFKNTWFSRFAERESIGDEALRAVVNQLEAGQIDADLGGGVYKQLGDALSVFPVMPIRGITVGGSPGSAPETGIPSMYTSPRSVTCYIFLYIKFKIIKIIK